MSENYVKTARRRRKFLEIAFLDVPEEQILHINNKDLLPTKNFGIWKTHDFLTILTFF